MNDEHYNRQCCFAFQVREGSILKAEDDQIDNGISARILCLSLFLLFVCQCVRLSVPVCLICVVFVGRAA